MPRAMTLAGLVALTAAAGARADLITNGGFETQDFTGWTQWGNTGASFVADVPANVHGHQWAAWFGPSGSSGGIRQTLAVSANSTVQLSFWLSIGGLPRFNTNFFRVTLDGQALTTLTNRDAEDYRFYTFDVPILNDNPILEFEFQYNAAYFYLDDVTAVTIVPLPPGAAIGIAGRAGVAGVTRWRRRRILAAR